MEPLSHTSFTSRNLKSLELLSIEKKLEIREMKYDHKWACDHTFLIGTGKSA